jgi:hypothetical protein
MSRAPVLQHPSRPLRQRAGLPHWAGRRAAAWQREGPPLVQARPDPLVLQLYFWACPSFVVPILGKVLMPAAPRRPGQHPLHFLLRGQPKTPEETTNLADTQRHASPRVALNVAKLLGLGGSSVFFGSSGGRWAARCTVNSAYAPMAKVICRYHPVQLRTSQ